MNVSQLIEWLKTQDQEATVEVLRHSSGCGYYDQGGSVTTVDFEPAHSEYTDFRGNQFVKAGDKLENKRFLLLGTKDN